MKNLKKRALAMVLTLVMVLGLIPSALATGQTFSDVPSTFWGYADIEAAAEAGLMNGTGNGEFSPNLKVSVAQFLTLLGRLVFPETKVNEGDTWFGPYVSAAQNAGLLTGTQVNVNDVEAEISRYDMAVILRAAAKELGVTEKSAQSSEVTDYLDIPNRYTEAVLAVYGMGLIKGDQAGNFNGGNTMMRAEVATVIMRLAKAKPNGITNPSETPLPSTTTEPQDPTSVTTEPQYTWLAEAGCAPRRDYDPNAVELIQGTDLWINRGYRSPEINGTPYAGYIYFNVGDTYQFAIEKVPAGYGYTAADVTWSSDNENVARVDSTGFVTIVGPGDAYIEVTIPVIYYGDIWTKKMDSIHLFVDP